MSVCVLSQGPGWFLQWGWQSGNSEVTVREIQGKKKKIQNLKFKKLL